jgi:hypothetical protein
MSNKKLLFQFELFELFDNHCRSESKLETIQDGSEYLKTNFGIFKKEKCKFY